MSDIYKLFVKFKLNIADIAIFETQFKHELKYFEADVFEICSWVYDQLKLQRKQKLPRFMSKPTPYHQTHWCVVYFQSMLFEKRRHKI